MNEKFCFVEVLTVAQCKMNPSSHVLRSKQKQKEARAKKKEAQAARKQDDGIEEFFTEGYLEMEKAQGRRR